MRPPRNGAEQKGKKQKRNAARANLGDGRVAQNGQAADAAHQIDAGPVDQTDDDQASRRRAAQRPDGVRNALGLAQVHLFFLG